MSKKQHGLITIFLIAATLLLAFPATVFADGGGEEGLEKEVDGYHVKLVFAETVKVGENKFHIPLTVALGAPVAGAKSLPCRPKEWMTDTARKRNLPSA
jgi:hypothetical protein